jgi:hypothetical protein
MNMEDDVSRDAWDLRRRVAGRPGLESETAVTLGPPHPQTQRNGAWLLWSCVPRGCRPAHRAPTSQPRASHICISGLCLVGEIDLFSFMAGRVLLLVVFITETGL